MKKKILMATLLAFNVAGVALISTNLTNLHTLDVVKGEKVYKSMDLDESNNPTTSTEYVTEVNTDLDGNTNQPLTYKNVKYLADGHATLNAGGSIVKNNFSYELASITAVFDGELTIFTGEKVGAAYSYNENNLVYEYKLTSRSTIDIKGNYFKIVADVETDIDSLTISYGCTTPSSYTRKAIQFNGTTISLEDWNETYPNAKATLFNNDNCLKFTLNGTASIDASDTFDLTNFSSSIIAGEGTLKVNVLSTMPQTKNDKPDIPLIKTNICTIEEKANVSLIGLSNHTSRASSIGFFNSNILNIKGGLESQFFTYALDSLDATSLTIGNSANVYLHDCTIGYYAGTYGLKFTNSGKLTFKNLADKGIFIRRDKVSLLFKDSSKTIFDSVSECISGDNTSTMEITDYAEMEVINGLDDFFYANCSNDIDLTFIASGNSKLTVDCAGCGFETGDPAKPGQIYVYFRDNATIDLKCGAFGVKNYTDFIISNVDGDGNYIQNNVSFTLLNTSDNNSILSTRLSGANNNIVFNSSKEIKILKDPKAANKNGSGIYLRSVNATAEFHFLSNFTISGYNYAMIEDSTVSWSTKSEYTASTADFSGCTNTIQGNGSSNYAPSKLINSFRIL